MNPTDLRLPPESPRPRRGVLTRVSEFLGFFRWAYMPAGLFALLAVGVHAAADTVDDRLLWLVDHADALLDAAFASWSVTEPLVNLVGTEGRTLSARAVTFAWELLAGALIAVPALGYREEDAARVSVAARPRTWRALLERVVRQPTTVRLTRPLLTGAFVLAGACAIARMSQGALYLWLRQGPAGDEFAGPFARLLAIAALLLVLATFGWRAVLRSLQHADKVSGVATSRLRAVRVGLVGSVLVAPIALAALLDASPVLSFFR